MARGADTGSIRAVVVSRRDVSYPGGRGQGLVRGEAGSPFQVERDVHDDHAFLEEQRSLEQQGPLVVQRVLPPPCRQDLGQHDRDPSLGVFLQNILDEREKASHDRSVRRR